MDLSNRELAALVWIAVFLGIVFFKNKNGGVLKAFKNLIFAFFVPQIIVVMLWAILWIVLCVQALCYIDAWEISNFKTTILWGVAFAFVTLLDVNRISEDNTFFYNTIRDTVSATAAITFIAEAYSFSLLLELILFPFLFVITALQIVSEKKQEHAVVHKLGTSVLVVVGSIYIVYGIYMVTTDIDEFFTWNNLREFFIPIILSLLFLPYLYLISVLMTYERIWIGLSFSFKGDESLFRYAMLQALIRFRFDLNGLRRWKRNVGIFSLCNREAVRQSITDVKQYQKRELSPSVVLAELGWCPVSATKFLVDENLEAGDYHRSFDDEWSASSPYFIINDESLLYSNIAYYISGNLHAVKQLKVVLNVNMSEDKVIADTQFFYVCKILLETAVGDFFSEILEQIASNEVVNTEVNGRCVRLEMESHINTLRGGYTRKLIIDHAR